MTTQNDLNNIAYCTYGGSALSGAKFINVQQGNVGTGDIDLYTCPAGKRAALFGCSLYNANALTVTSFLEIKVSGVYYQVAASATTATTASLIPNQLVPIIEAGEGFAINLNRTTINVFGRVLEFDNTSCLKSSRILALANGNNTLYTVTTGKTGFILGQANNLFSTTGHIFVYNNSGNIRSYTPYNVPFGGSPGSTNQCFVTGNGGNNTQTLYVTPLTMNSGDFIVLNTSSGAATQTAWVNVVEI